ncbi:MAG: PQQ-binding-like beta-propeller repeat protein [Deltaproteobacteria bacterium]|nr:PQQ-binding-like beta-propeller repeat protein [Deltaproteobacteria bacterium]
MWPVPVPPPHVALEGSVYSDTNGDGVRQVGERGVAGAVVAYERSLFTTTDAEGRYLIDAPAAGLVWVRVPDGFRPGAVWRRAELTSTNIDLALVPLTPEEAASPVTFVVASDSHTTNEPTDKWDGGNLVDALEQATALPEPPRFFTIVGDITQANRIEEFQRVAAAIATIAVPWVPVAGNHDWYDGGANYRGFFGIDTYSFDIGNVHFTVWDTNLSEADQLAFFAADLARVPPEMTVIGLGHASPSDSVAAALEVLGVDYLFTGHWHSNRRLDRGSITEWGTQTFIMGGIDQSPSGYRVVTITGDEIVVEHRERLLRSHFEAISPRPGTCASPAGFPIIAAAAFDATTPDVLVRIDCGAALPLVSAGGWSFRGVAPPLAIGEHTLTFEATTGRTRLIRSVPIEVCDAEASALALGEWPQLGGGAAHVGARAAPVVPPLGPRWTSTIGGTLSLGSPVIAGGLVVVATTDNGAGDRGGLVALDLLTGAERWRYRTPAPAVGAAAIDNGTVVVATKTGEIHAVALADGSQRWRRVASEGAPTFEASLWAPPTIADGLVYVALQSNFTALDLATGNPVWSRDPDDPQFTWLGSLAAVAVDDGHAVAAFNRTLGLANWSSYTGAPQWSVRDGRTEAINATPLIDGGVVYVVNAAGAVSAAELATGTIQWTVSVTPGAFEWDYSVTATPAIAGGRLFVPTQWSDLVALDAATGRELWRFGTAGGPLNFAHYRSAQPGFAASPVVTGDIVWIGAPDGRLLALSVEDGHVLWQTQLGAPIVSAPAPAGDALVVATFDGTVRLLAPAVPRAPRVSPIAMCPTTSRGTPATGGCAAGADPSIALAALALGFGLRRRRRQRRRP